MNKTTSSTTNASKTIKEKDIKKTRKVEQQNNSRLPWICVVVITCLNLLRSRKNVSTCMNLLRSSKNVSFYYYSDNNNNNNNYYYYNDIATTNKTIHVNITKADERDDNNNNNNKKYNNIEFKFPSIEERVKYYMGGWYDNQTTIINQTDLCNEVKYYEKQPQWYDIPYIYDHNNSRDAPDHYMNDMRMYYYKHVQNNSRFILSLADDQTYYNFPVMIKAREIVPKEKQPLDYIITYMNVERHFGSVDTLMYLQKHNNTIIPTWENKYNKLIWRGATTGGTKRINVVRRYYKYNNISDDDIDIAFNEYIQDDQKEEEEQNNINETELILFQRNGKTIEDLLKYKYLLSLEGNDVATGLKWMLYSNSVVFMPKPTHITWTMENKLIPFYHYIPLNDNVTNIKEMIDWAKENDELCKNISLHATTYIEDLYASDNANKTNDQITQIIAQRYQNLYGNMLQQC